MNNERAMQIIADHDLVNSMISNLRCCPADWAERTINALIERVSNGGPAYGVPGDVTEALLAALPTMDEGYNEQDGQPQYRAGHDAIAECCRLINESMTARLASVGRGPTVTSR